MLVTVCDRQIWMSEVIVLPVKVALAPKSFAVAAHSAVTTKMFVISIVMLGR